MSREETSGNKENQNTNFKDLYRKPKDQTPSPLLSSRKPGDSESKAVTMFSPTIQED
jgi:hypothetical protein